MKYKLVKRVNPQDKSKEMLYAAPVNDGKITKSEITKEVVDISSLSRGDTSNVIENVIDVIPKYLLMGKSVSLGDLGTFRLSFSSSGVVNEKDFKLNMIGNVKVIFTPSPELKKKLGNIKFEKGY